MQYFLAKYRTLNAYLATGDLLKLKEAVEEIKDTYKTHKSLRNGQLHADNVMKYIKTVNDGEDSPIPYIAINRAIALNYIILWRSQVFSLHCLYECIFNDNQSMVHEIKWLQEDLQSYEDIAKKFGFYHYIKYLNRAEASELAEQMPTLLKEDFISDKAIKNLDKFDPYITHVDTSKYGFWIKKILNHWRN